MWIRFDLTFKDFKKNDQFFKSTKYVSTELLSSSVEWFTKHAKLNNK